MQEEITQRTVSLSVEAGKMTADLLQKALKKVLEEMQKKPSQRTLRQGKQTLDREKRPTIRERLAQAQEQAKTKHREREKVKAKDREVAR